MLKRPELVAVILGAFMLSAQTVLPVERFRPPSEQLREPENVLAVASAHEIIPPNRIRFEVVRFLSDERAEMLTDAPGELPPTPHDPSQEGVTDDRSRVVRMSPETVTKVVAGTTYIIGISRYLKGRFPLPKWRVDPEGYRLVSLPVVGEAIFSHSPHVEFLLTTTTEVYDESPRNVLAHLVPLLWSANPADRRCAVVELYFHPGLGDELGQKVITRLRSTIEDESDDPVIRDYMLQAASMFPASRKPDWVLLSARTVIRQAPLEVELGSPVPTFQHTALRLLKERGVPQDLDIAARMLRSSSPGVALSALQTMEALDREGAVERARAALSIAGLPEQSKRYIESFLTRAEHVNGQESER